MNRDASLPLTPLDVFDALREVGYAAHVGQSRLVGCQSGPQLPSHNISLRVCFAEPKPPCFAPTPDARLRLSARLYGDLPTDIVYRWSFGKIFAPVVSRDGTLVLDGEAVAVGGFTADALIQITNLCDRIVDDILPRLREELAYATQADLLGWSRAFARLHIYPDATLLGEISAAPRDLQCGVCTRLGVEIIPDLDAIIRMLIAVVAAEPSGTPRTVPTTAIPDAKVTTLRPKRPNRAVEKASPQRQPTLIVATRPSP